jgi:hypothetical protein
VTLVTVFDIEEGGRARTPRAHHIDMIEGLIVTLLTLAAVVLVPLFLVFALLRLVAGIVLLPFRLVGGVLKLLLGSLGIVVKLVGSVFGVAAGVLGVIVAVFILPLIPILIVGGLVWLVMRRPRLRAVA